MLEWWDTHQKLIARSGLTEEIIDKVSQNNSKIFRDGAGAFLETLNKFKIPTLIFSAGIGNIISRMLRYNNMEYGNMHIIANNYTFNKDGSIMPPVEIIHSFNKNETVLDNYPFSKEIENRPNIILIGNSLGDINMVSPKTDQNVLKIGFLDKPQNNQLKMFQEGFDVVATENTTFEFINEMIKEIN